MAMGTRSKDQQDLTSILAQLQSSIDTLTQASRGMQQDINQLRMEQVMTRSHIEEQLQEVETKLQGTLTSENQAKNSERPHRRHNLYEQDQTFKMPKLDFPKFSGKDVDGWLCWVDQFFSLHNVPIYHRVQMASFNLESEALHWFQWLRVNHPDPSWEYFESQLLTRFGPSDYEDFTEALIRLKQTSTVHDY